MKNTLLELSYENWKEIASAYISLPNSILKTSLQLFPFSKLSDTDKKVLLSKTFFEKYIINCSFFLNPKNVLVTDNYLLKADDSFRQSTLISSLLFLVFQAIGKEIFNNCILKIQGNIFIHYAGNYYSNNLSVHYKKEYDSFYKELNAEKSIFSYFIKTDIKNFYSNINIDKLINMIEHFDVHHKFSPQFLYFYKELLSYCGKNKFPCIEHSVASSFLASKVYLKDIDEALINFLNTYPNILSFRLYRYVDDLYILFDIKNAEEKLLNKIYSDIIFRYSSILKEYDLQLNFEKTKFGEADNINEELWQSLYDSDYHYTDFELFDFYKNNVISLFDELSELVDSKCLSISNYQDSINKHLSIDDIDYSPQEVFRHFVFNDFKNNKNEKAELWLKKLLETNITDVKVDPKHITILITESKNKYLISSLIKYLIYIHNKKRWDGYHTTISITYLIQRSFIHEKLINILKDECPMLEQFITTSCHNSFMTNLFDGIENKKIEIMNTDWKSYYLFIMYYISNNKNDYYTAYAYFKTFFDRMTALMDLRIRQRTNPALTTPRYRKFYTENQLKDFYKEIPGAEGVLANAEIFRNQNPLAHSSSELLDKETTNDDLVNSILELQRLLECYISKYF